MTRTALTLFALLALAVTAEGQRGSSDLYEVKIRKIKDGVYLAYRPEPLRHFVEGNVTIIVNDRDVVLVDAGGSPTSARNIIAEVRKLTPNPVRYVINTHDHVDHTLGNQEYAKAFPGVEILSHRAAREHLLTDGREYVEKIVGSVDSQIASTREKIAQVRAEGKPGNEKVVAYMERYIDKDIHTRYDEYRRATITPATATFEQKLLLYRGQRTIEVLFLGHGDTEGDAVVYLPQDRLVCTGDMVVHPIPYGFSTQPLQWLATLGKLSELDFEYLVPGHGELQSGKGYLKRVMSLLTSVQSQVEAAVGAGLDLEATRAKVDLSAYVEEFTKGDPVAEYRFRGWFINPSVGEMFEAVKRRRAEAGGASTSGPRD